MIKKGPVETQEETDYGVVLVAKDLKHPLLVDNRRRFFFINNFYVITLFI